MQLADFIEKTIGGMGYELVDFEISPRARLLRIFIDKPEGSGEMVTVDDCASVSRHLSHVFTVENVDYDRLEVSSPGMDRPLTRVADYRRFAGQEVQVKLRVPLGTQRNFSGILTGLIEADDTQRIGLQVEGRTLQLALDNIDRARLVPKF